jgi:hypothetical protein
VHPSIGGQSERCLSLVGNNGMTLDIMESSGENALMWFDAIRTVLSGGGADLTAESQGSDRRLSLARASVAAVQPWVRTPAEAMKLLQAGMNSLTLPIAKVDTWIITSVSWMSLMVLDQSHI